MTDSLNVFPSLCSRTKRSAPNDTVAPSPHGFTRSKYGVLLRKNWLDATFHFCSKGTYNTLLADYLCHQYQPFVFVDIGANQGLYSILSAQNMYCQHVVAFEPVSSTYSLLKTNISANRVSDIVHPVQAAVSLETGSTTITKKLGHSGAASLRTLPRWFHISETISTLGPDALRSYIPSTSNLIIKVDVEGHEKVVFEALASAGALNTAKAVFYEVNRGWSKEHALESILREYGFTDFTRTSPKTHHDVLATR
jgi:FkbM family methyltransferase